MLGDSNICAGFYFVSRTTPRKLRAIFLPKRVVLNPTGTKSVVLLGTTSDMTGSVKPGFVTQEVTHNFVAIVEKTLAPKSFVAGIPFKKADYPLMEPFAAKEDVDYVLLKIPCCLPIPYGVPLYVGKLDEQTAYDSLDFITDDGAKWGKFVLTADDALQILLSTNKVALDAILPIKKTGQTWAATTHFKTSKPDEDQEELLVQELESLSIAVKTARNHNIAESKKRQSAKSVGTPPTPWEAVEDEDGLSTSKAKPIQSFTIPKKSNLPGAASLASAVALSSEDIRRARFIVMFSRKDKDSGSLIAPIFTDEGESIITGTSASYRQQIMLSAFQTMAEEMSQEMHFLFRANDMPGRYDPLVLIYWTEMMCRVTPLASLIDATEKKGATLANFIPDSGKNNRKEAVDDERFVEELLGESKDHLTKISSSISVNTNLGRPGDALAFLSNITLFARCFVHIDEAAGVLPPQLFTNAMELAQLITSSSSRDMLRREPDVSSYVSFWAYSVMEHFFVQLAKQSRTNAVLRQVANGDLENVPTENHDLGMEAFDLGVKTYKMAMAGGVTLPEPIIYKNSEAKKRKMESALKEQANQLRLLMGTHTPSGPKAKTPKRPGDGDKLDNLANKKQNRNESSPGERLGCIIYPTSEANMPLPQFLQRSDRTCAAAIRDGYVCRHGERCMFSHDKLDNMSEALQRLWVNHAINTPDMFFNPVRVNSTLCREVAEAKRILAAAGQTKSPAAAAAAAAKKASTPTA